MIHVRPENSLTSNCHCGKAMGIQNHHFCRFCPLIKNSKAVEFKSSLAQSLAIIGVVYHSGLFPSHPPSSFDLAPLWNNKTKGMIYFILR